MKTKNLLIAAAVALSFVAPTQVLAEYGDDAYKERVALSKQIKKMKNMRKQLPSPPPAGLFGVYAFPEKGQYVAGVNFQHHEFDGLLNGSTSVSAATAITTAPSQFGPSTLKAIPHSAKANVILPFINYTLNDKIALVAMAPLIEKESNMESFSAGTYTDDAPYNYSPNDSVGKFTVKSKGLGDVKFGALYKAYNSEDNKHNIIIDAVLSAPTGSIEEADAQIAPMSAGTDFVGRFSNKRLGYGMQLGGGTWDAMVGAAYWGKEDKWGYGAQYLATIPLEDENKNGWRFGDKHELTAWSSYSWEPTLVSSFRLRAEHQDELHGLDPVLAAPGLGAQPGNYGGKIIEASVGVNYMYAPAKNISIEYVTPISQDRNGYQLNKESAIMISWRNAFF